MTAGRRYSDAERDEILRRAITRQEGSEDITHEELVDAAREIGLDPAKVEEAAAEIAKERARREDAREDDALVAAEVARRRGRFGRNLLTYVIVNAGLVTMNLVAGGSFWAIWPLLAWGLGLSLQATRALPSPSAEDRERILVRMSRRRARRAREQAKRARDAAMRAAGQEFEAAVEQGVAELLRAVSRGLELGGEAAGAHGTGGRTPGRVELEDAEPSEPLDGHDQRRQRRGR